MLTRRAFVGSALAASALARAQTIKTVAEVERPRVMAAAAKAMDVAVTPLLGVSDKPRSPMHASFAVAMAGVDAVPENAALRGFSTTVAALTSAFVLTREDKYAARAVEHVKASLFGRDFEAPSAGQDRPYEFLALATSAGILDLVPLAEFARATSFLGDAMGEELRGVAMKNFGAILHAMATTTVAMLARDAHDHRASAWLLVVSALARATQNQKQWDQCRVMFTKPTLRAQITADGKFPQEQASENPYRNSLMNFDLLAGCAQVLTTPFNSPWNDELPEGPGMRAVAAYLQPFIAERAHWPLPSDATHFRELPGKRAGLLLAGEAFHRPEYVATYAASSDDAPVAEIAYSFPITMPLLWTARAPHGL